MSKSVLEDQFEHHVWATQKVIDACMPLTGEQLAATVPGIYGSILATMRHLVSADRDYLRFMTGEAVGATASLVEFTEEEEGDLPVMRAVMEADRTAWLELLARDIDPGTIMAGHREDGSESRVAFGLRLAQAIQHGDDHRSQICTVLTSLGVEPPEIDFWSYARAAGRVEVTEPA